MNENQPFIIAKENVINQLLSCERFSRITKIESIPEVKIRWLNIKEIKSSFIELLL